jgi:hypothetical protein
MAVQGLMSTRNKPKRKKNSLGLPMARRWLGAMLLGIGLVPQAPSKSECGWRVWMPPNRPNRTVQQPTLGCVKNEFSELHIVGISNVSMFTGCIERPGLELFPRLSSVCMCH